MKILSKCKCAMSMKDIIILSSGIHTLSFMVCYLLKCPSWISNITCFYNVEKKMVRISNIHGLLFFNLNTLASSKEPLLILAASRVVGNGIGEEQEL